MSDTKSLMILPIRAADETATHELAQILAPLMRAGDTVRLEGTLGMGKTSFARALIRSFVGEDEPVPSPTFALMQEYPAPDFTIHHFDLYRLESPDELEELGFDDALNEGLCLIEWSEKGADYVPSDGLSIMFVPVPAEGEDVRLICLDAGTAWDNRRALLQKIAEDRQL